MPIKPFSKDEEVPVVPWHTHLYRALISLKIPMRHVRDAWFTLRRDHAGLFGVGDAEAIDRKSPGGPPLPADICEIAVIKLDHIGDLILASPVFHSLRCRFPSARITAVVSPGAACVLARNPNIDRIVTFDAPWHWRENAGAEELRRHLVQGWKSFAELQETTFDLVVNLRSDEKNVAFAATLPHRALLSYSYRTAYASLITHTLPWVKTHSTEQHRRLLASIGADEWIAPRLYPDPNDYDRAFSVHRPSRGTVVFFLGAAMPYRRWSSVKFKELAGRLISKGREVVIVGSSSDSALSSEWDSATGCVNLCGKFSILELFAYLENTGCMVTNDSGPMHLAAAAGIPVVCTMRDRAHTEFAPVGNCHVVFIKKTCSGPCSDNPATKDAACTCIQTVTVDEMEAAVERVLASHR